MKTITCYENSYFKFSFKGTFSQNQYASGGRVKMLVKFFYCSGRTFGRHHEGNNYQSLEYFSDKKLLLTVFFIKPTRLIDGVIKSKKFIYA